MRTIAFLALAVCAAVTSPAAPSGAAPGPGFHGSCAVTGAETFTPALAARPRAGAAVVAASGTCTGTVVDPAGVAHQVSKAPARYRQSTTSGSVSCAGGVLSGTGTISIVGQDLAFRVVEPQVAVISALHLSGSGWSAIGVAGVIGEKQPLNLATACFGAGIPSVQVAINFSTLG